MHVNFWSGFTRTAAEIHFEGHLYRVDLRQFTLGRDATLSRDGTVVSQASTPARFDIGNGAYIEIAATEHGFSRAMLHTADSTTRLVPASGTWEEGRQKWGRRHPRANRLISAASTIIVVLGLLLIVLQLLQTLTSVAFIRDLLGGWSYTLPLSFDPAALVAIGVIVGAGALDRALRMR